LKYDNKFIIGRLNTDSAERNPGNGYDPATWNRLAIRSITINGKASISIRLTKIWNLNLQMRAKTLLYKGDFGGLGGGSWFSIWLAMVDRFG
jgi:hypothetical protein